MDRRRVLGKKPTHCAMPESDTWRIVDCPDCSAKFKAPAAIGDGESLACPACGFEIRSEPDPIDDFEFDLESDLDSEFEESASEAPATPPRAKSPVETSSLPLPTKKPVEMDLSGLAVRDANKKPHELSSLETSAPKLDHLEKLASTSDEAFVPDDEEPRQRVTSKRVQQEIMGWDDGDETGGRSSSQSTVATTFKLVLISLPVLIGVGIFALNARPNAGTRSVVDTADLDLPAEGDAEEQPAAPPPNPEAVDALHMEIGDAAFIEMLKEAVEAFAASSTIEERLAYVRDPDRVRPLMTSFYASQPIEPIAIDDIAPGSRVQIERGFAVTSVVLPDFEMLPIVLARRDGRLVVDWESFVGYCEIPLKQFVAEQRTTPTLFRLRARLDDYYNFEFTENRHICLGLADLKLTQKVYAYVERGSDLADQIYTRIAKNQGGLDFVIVKLRFPPNAQSPNQVLLDEFIEIGWLLDNEEA